MSTSIPGQKTPRRHRTPRTRGRRLAAVKATTTVALALLLWLPADEAAAWEWTLVPYLWASDVALDLSVDGNEAIGGDASFKDLVDKLDGAFSFHFEGRQEKIGFYFDLFLIGLADSTITTGEGRLPLPPGTIADTNLDLTIVDAGGFLRVTGDDRTGFDLLAGVRYLAVDQQTKVTLPIMPAPSTTGGIDADFTDALLGVRYSTEFGEKWAGNARLDTSFGDTDGTLGASLGVSYNWGQEGKYGLLLAYQFLGVEVEEKSPIGQITTDITMSGPKLGFKIRWGS